MGNENNVTTKTTLGVQFTSLHNIDHNNGLIIPIDVDSRSAALEEYIKRLIEDIKEKSSKRHFEFKSETTEVRHAIDLFIKGNYVEASEINANRLLSVEQDTQKEMDKLSISIQKGSLFQTVINYDEDSKMIIIGKADQNDFLDASDFAVHNGLPWKKRIFKSFLAFTDYSGNIKKVLVSDTTNTLMKYWWSDFFELSEIRTDKHNTIKFLEILDRKVFNPIKKDYPADHTTLRNSVIGYFRNQNDFDLDTMFELIFQNYSPYEIKLPLDNIKRIIKEIPEKYKLDSQFTIDKTEISKRAVNRIFLNDGMELVLKDSLDFNGLITSFEDKEGEKYIAIKSEEGYKRFPPKRHESI